MLLYVDKCIIFGIGCLPLVKLHIRIIVLCFYCVFNQLLRAFYYILSAQRQVGSVVNWTDVKVRHRFARKSDRVTIRSPVKSPVFPDSTINHRYFLSFRMVNISRRVIAMVKQARTQHVLSCQILKTNLIWGRCFNQLQLTMKYCIIFFICIYACVLENTCCHCIFKTCAFYILLITGFQVMNKDTNKTYQTIQNANGIYRVHTCKYAAYSFAC